MAYSLKRRMKEAEEMITTLVREGERDLKHNHEMDMILKRRIIKLERKLEKRK